MGKITRQKWDDSDLIKLFTYINNHFDSWYDDPCEVYSNAMKEIDPSRNVDSVKRKVAKAMGAINNNKKKKEMAIWRNKKLRSLIGEVLKKEEEKKKGSRGTARKRSVSDDEETSRKKTRVESDITIIDLTSCEENQISTNQTSHDYTVEEIDKIFNRKMQELERDYKEIIHAAEQVSNLEALRNQKNDERRIKTEKLKNFTGFI